MPQMANLDVQAPMMATQGLCRNETQAEKAATRWAAAYDELERAVIAANQAKSRLAAAQHAQDEAWSNLNAVASGAAASPAMPPAEYEANIYGSKYGTRKG